MLKYAHEKFMLLTQELDMGLSDIIRKRLQGLGQGYAKSSLQADHTRLFHSQD